MFGQPPIPDPNTTTPPQQAQQPPVPSSDKTTTQTQNQITDRFVMDPETTELREVRPETEAERREREAARDALDLF